jgi:hypothetical protein
MHQTEDAKPLELRTLGTTGLRVSPLCIATYLLLIRLTRCGCHVGFHRKDDPLVVLVGLERFV